MSVPWKLRQYLSHLRKARGPFRLHSPFVFTFHQRVLRGRGLPSPPPLLQGLRREWLQDKALITHHPLGCAEGRELSEPVAQLARRTAISGGDTRRLFHLAAFLKPRTVLDLGSGLGFSALALALGAPQARVLSLEGDAAVHALAVERLSPLAPPGLRFLQGAFRELLPELLEGPGRPDLVFLDGDHRQEETIYLGQLILPRLSRHGVLAIHDIHASEGMLGAWERLREMPEVTVSLTTWSTGFLFVNESLSTQHFRLRSW
ncbi:MAG TPA: class I SAM-dependent methyltransferase [Bacteroidales bacterium]|nr:class I SAM-dependent methyltransferase [Bacteroidales bacterium]